MKNIVLITALALGLVGCASADKVTMPKGKWKLINQTGFIPASTQRYIEGVDINVNEEMSGKNITDSNEDINLSNDAEAGEAGEAGEASEASEASEAKVTDQASLL